MSNLVDIIMPADQLEGSSAKLAQWLVGIGTEVKQGQAIAELETDKVVMEISSPCAGQLHSVLVKTGDTIQTDIALGYIEPIGSVNNPAKANTSALPQNTLYSPQSLETETEPKTQLCQNPKVTTLLSPAVRRLLKTHALNAEQITGSGRNGRVTRNDVLNFHQNLNPSPVAQTPASTTLHSRMVPHSNMRRSIAKHMVESLLHTSPHVTSVFEMNLSNIIEHRRWHKKEFAEAQINLTFTAYFLAAIVKAMQHVPQVNARFHEDALEIFSNINIGVGTALGDAGLIVPVIENVQSMRLKDIARALTLQTEKARQGKITPSDMKNGTFTLSNHGVSGSLFAAPIIIHQPQVAILGIGKMDKRVVVRETNGVDTMVIQPMCYVSLSIDHRALDAHQTNLFLSHFVETIEHWGE